MRDVLRVLDAGCLALTPGAGTLLRERDPDTGRLMHEAGKLWHCFVASTMLRDRQRHLPSVFSECMQLVFPESSVAWLEQWKASAMPSASALQRLTLDVDVAWMLRARAHFSSEPLLFFGWADSSVQGGADWLLVSHDSVSPDKIID
eukprot:12532724-Alexandrium_andersonii.AAC.1